MILIFVAIGAFAGSNTGIFKLQTNFAIAFIMPIILGLSYQKINKHILFVTVAYLGLLGFGYKATHSYRDVPIWQQNYIAQEDIFRGISTKKSKVTELLGFTKSIREIIPEKKYATINQTFAVALVLNKQPYSVCWFTDHEKLEQSINQGQIKYIVLTHHNLSAPQWAMPDKQIINYRQQLNQKIFSIVNKYCKQMAHSPHKIFLLYQVK